MILTKQSVTVTKWERPRRFKLEYYKVFLKFFLIFMSRRHCYWIMFIGEMFTNMFIIYCKYCEFYLAAVRFVCLLRLIFLLMNTVLYQLLSLLQLIHIPDFVGQLHSSQLLLAVLQSGFHSLTAINEKMFF